MKKLKGLLFVATLVTLFVFIGSVNVGHVQAQVTNSCPSGFNSVIYNGYSVCIPNGYSLPNSGATTPIPPNGNSIPSTGGGSIGTSIPCYVFNTNLSIGSNGPDVAALQAWLIAKGFDISTARTDNSQRGYFGVLTANAVSKYQASVGIQNTGFFGPLTRAAINNSCTDTKSDNGTQYHKGVLRIADNNYLAEGIFVNRGQSYEIASYKAVASGTDMIINNFSIDFGARLWLYADSLTVRDDTGAIVGQVNPLSVADFTEIAPGTDYRLYIPVNDYLIKLNQMKNLTLSIHFKDKSDRESATMSLISFQTRATDASGVSDIEIVGGISGGVSKIIYYGSQSVEPVSITTDPMTPSSRTIVISQTQMTSNVVLGVFDVKSAGSSAYIRSIKFNTNSHLLTPNSLFSSIQITVGSKTYNASAIADDSVSFTDMNIPLPADVLVPITMLGTVRPDTDGTISGRSVSFILNANKNNLYVEAPDGTHLAVASRTINTWPMTFGNSIASLGNLSVVSGPCISTQNVWNSNCQASYNFTITSNKSPLYIANSNYPNHKKVVDLQIVHGNAKLNDGSIMTAVPGYLAGDSSAYFIIPAGTSRSFTFYASVGNAVCYGYCNVSAAVKAINYGSSPSDLYSMSFISNLDTLLVNFLMSGIGSAPSTSDNSSSASNATTFTPPIQTSTIAKLQASLLPSNNDMAGTWNTFASGKGAGGEGTDSVDDWNVNANVTLSVGTSIKSITMRETNGEYWSTDNNQYYPLVVIDNSGYKLTSQYTSNLGKFTAGNYSWKIYGQKNNTKWTDGYLIIEFTDGTVAVTKIAPYNTASSYPSPSPSYTPTPTYSPLSVSCMSYPFNKGIPGATWSANVSGGLAPYKYAWSVYNDVSSYGEGSTQSSGFMANYSTPGSKSAVVRVTDSSGNTKSATCSASIMTYGGTSVQTYPQATTPTYSPTYTPSPTYTASPSVTATVTVPSPVTASCYGNAYNNGKPTVTWSAEARGGVAPYKYYWSLSGVSSIISGSVTSDSFTASYPNSGAVQANLRVVDGSGTLTSASCYGNIPAYTSASPSATASPSSSPTSMNQNSLNASVWDAVKEWFSTQR